MAGGAGVLLEGGGGWAADTSQVRCGVHGPGHNHSAYLSWTVSLTFPFRLTFIFRDNLTYASSSKSKS